MSPADFYAKEVTTIVAPFGAGGGTDFAARIVGAFWPDAMGGTARVKNMSGGGTVVGSNFVWKAKPDGLTLEVGPMGTTLGATTVFPSKSKEFDTSKFRYIGGFSNEPWVLSVGKDSPINSVDDLLKAKNFKLAVTAKVGGPALGSVIALHVLGLEDAVVISGYDSTPEMGLAIAKGEVDGMVMAAGSTGAERDKGFVKGIVTVGPDTTPLFEGIPAMTEAVKMSPEKAELLNIFAGAFKAERVLFGPPGIDEAKVKYLRESWNKMMELKGFQRHAKARYKVLAPPSKGEDVEKMILALNNMPKTQVDMMSQLIETYVK